MEDTDKPNQELIKCKENLDLILKHTNNVYYNYVFKDATWSFISESVYQAIGVTAEDYISGGVEKAITYIHPDDVKVLDNHLKHILENKLEKNYNPHIVYRMKHQKTGEWRWMSDCRHVIFDEEGEPVSLFGNSTDVTDKRNAEEALEKRVAEAEKMNKVMIGRELRMKELKDEIKRLKESDNS